VAANDLLLLRLNWIRIGLVIGRNVPEYIKRAIGIDCPCRAGSAAQTCGSTKVLGIFRFL